jgi:hypothetical protein
VIDARRVPSAIAAGLTTRQSRLGTIAALVGLVVTIFTMNVPGA